MSKKGILRTKDEGQIVDYYPQTTYDNVIDEKGGTLDKDITNLKSFQSTATTKLNGIANNATKTEKSSTNGNVIINGSETVVYTHPTTSGNKHIPAGGSSGQILRWAADGTATWGADNNTTYSVATSAANGLMSSTDKAKLDGIASGANNYSHPTGDGNLHVPANGTTNSGKYLQATGTAGTYQWATLPSASTSAAGIVQLSSAINSTSTSLAATASAVKAAYDLAAGKANASHGNHVPSTQSANNAVFLRNDNTWATVTPDNIGAIPQPTDLTGKTVDIDTYNLSAGTPKKQYYVETSTGGATNISNIPIKEPFTLEVESIRWASVSDYITKQTFVSATTKSTYERWCTNGTWTAWLNTVKMDATPVSGQVLIANGTTGGVKTSGFTIAKSVPSNAVFTDTTYSVATTSANGLMSSTDKTKLDGIETGATRTILNNTVTSTSTSEAATANAVKTAYDKANHAHPYAATSHGNHVPTTQTANNAVFLRNDNTWATVTPANIGAAASVHYHTSIVHKDDRGTNVTPAALDQGISCTLKTNTTDALNDGGQYHAILSVKQWNDNSGGLFHQLGFTDNSNVWYRSGNSATWNGWNKIYHSGSKPTPAEIGAAAASHGNHVPATGSANARIFLRNDNTWQSLPTASTSATGIVQLSSSVSSTSTTMAANCYAVKLAYDSATTAVNATRGSVTNITLTNGWYSVDMSTYEMTDIFRVIKIVGVVTLEFTTLMNDSMSPAPIIGFLPAGSRPGKKLVFSDGFGNNISIDTEGVISANKINDMGWVQPITYVAYK